jgi:hypothetical protein
MLPPYNLQALSVEEAYPVSTLVPNDVMMALIKYFDANVYSKSLGVPYTSDCWKSVTSSSLAIHVIECIRSFHFNINEDFKRDAAKVLMMTGLFDIYNQLNDVRQSRAVLRQNIRIISELNYPAKVADYLLYHYTSSKEGKKEYYMDKKDK